jgi:hypothetical protein
MIAELHGDQEGVGFFGDRHPVRDRHHILTDGQECHVEREVLGVLGGGFHRGLVCQGKAP